MLEFVDYDIHSAASRFLIHLLVESRREVQWVLPCGLAMCGGGFVGIFEVLPKTLHVVLDVGGVTLSGVRLGQGPNLRQSSGDLCRVTDVFYGCEWHGRVGSLIDSGVHELLGVFAPL